MRARARAARAKSARGNSSFPGVHYRTVVGLSSDPPAAAGGRYRRRCPPLPRRRLLCALALALLASPATAQRAPYRSAASRARARSWRITLLRAGRDAEPTPVVAFYYAWYGNPENDGSYRHWNHAALPHWDAAVNAATFGHGPGRGGAAARPPGAAPTSTRRFTW